ncbi:Uncharacterised protein [Raoultella ornithinolytica]|nr:Uncharacterised protein [Raoultella ornithinolytica]
MSILVKTKLCFIFKVGNTQSVFPGVSNREGCGSDK